MTINCNGALIDLSIPKVMGILNVKPNSFFDGGHYPDSKSMLKQVDKMLNEGATFIDIGAYSSKPNAEFVSEEEEICINNYILGGEILESSTVFLLTKKGLLFADAIAENLFRLNESKSLLL